MSACRVYLKDEGGCSTGFHIPAQSNKIGQDSKYGSVFPTCCGSQCSFVTKVQPWDAATEHEAQMQHLAAQRGLAPKVYSAMLCSQPRETRVVMDRMQRTLQEVISGFTAEQRDFLEPMVHHHAWAVLNHEDVAQWLTLQDEDEFDLFSAKLRVQDLIRRYSDIASLEEGLSLIHSVAQLCPVPYVQSFVEYMRSNVPEDSVDQRRERVRAIQSSLRLVDELHATFILHNDLHWGNFMCDERGQWKIIDFGLSTRSREPLDYKREREQWAGQVVLWSEQWPNLSYLRGLVTAFTEQTQLQRGTHWRPAPRLVRRGTQ